MDMIFTIGIFTALFFFVLLLNKKNKSLPDRILAIWMLIIAVHLTSTYLYIEGYWELHPHLVGITAPLPLLYGPMLYLYVSYSVIENKQLRQKDYWHFLPVVLSYLNMCRFYFFYSAEEKTMVYQGVIDDFGSFATLLVVGIIVSAVAYSILAYRLLNRHQSLVENNFSNTEQINLNWLRSFIWAVALVFFTITIVLVSRDVLGVRFPFNPDFIFYAMIVFGVLSLGYFGIRHENIFADNVLRETPEELKTAYKNSSLDEQLAGEKHLALKQLMVEEKPYLESNLTLHGLAERMDISLHHLSQIINQFEGQNFNDFVNRYRVEEFIERASSNKHFSFLALALDSGFNSKSTFNAVFRKHKGVTPSQYMSSKSVRIP